LAAGDGSRIKSITYGAYPKEMLPIGNVPTIRFPLEALRLANIRSVLVVIAPQTKHGIIDGLRSGRRFNTDIYYAVQERDNTLHSGMGVAILTAKGWIDGENFVVACGDTILCDFFRRNPLDCLQSIIASHERNSAIATALVYPTKSDPRRFGVVKFRSIQEQNGTMFGELADMVEKPNTRVAKSLKPNGYYYVMSGYYVFKPSIFSYIEKTKPDSKNEIQITDAIKLAIENGEKVNAFMHAKIRNGKMIPCEYWDVGIPEDYKRANERLLGEKIDKCLRSEG